MNFSRILLAASLLMAGTLARGEHVLLSQMQNGIARPDSVAAATWNKAVAEVHALMDPQGNVRFIAALKQATVSRIIPSEQRMKLMSLKDGAMGGVDFVTVVSMVIEKPDLADVISPGQLLSAWVKQFLRNACDKIVDPECCAKAKTCMIDPGSGKCMPRGAGN